MLETVKLLLIICGIVKSSEIHPVAPAGIAPIVTAASSQYFERTFNRLVPTPPVLGPVLPFAPPPVVPPIISVTPAFGPAPPVLSVLPIAPVPPVAIDSTRTTSVPVNPTNAPPSNAPAEPSIAIAVASAHAAPVATILLPPYPFGFPSAFGVLPQAPQLPPDPNTRESTTLKTTTRAQATITQREEDATTPIPSNIDNSFAQPFPSNQNFNFRQYLEPQLPVQRPRPSQLPAPPIPQQFPEPNLRPQQYSGPDSRPQQFPGADPKPQQFPGRNPKPQQFSPWPQQVPQHLPVPNPRPIKFTTNVEVVPVPLAYIAPPSPYQQHHHQHHHHHHHQSLKVTPHIHTFLPKMAKIIIRPVSALTRIRTLRVPASFMTYGPPKLVRRLALKSPQDIRSSSRETEPTSFKPINAPFKSPSRL